MSSSYLSVNPMVIGSFYIIFAVVGTCANIGVLAVILRDWKLRTNGMYIPVILLTIVDLLVSVFQCPVGAKNNLSSYTSFCGITITSGYMYFIFMAITMYGMALLYINHIAHIRHPNQTRQRNCGIAGTIAVGVITIVAFTVTINAVGVYNVNCRLLFTRSSLIGLLVGSYFAPLGILCLLGIVMIMLHSTNNGPSRVVNSTFDTQQPTRFPSHLIVAGFIVSFTAGPEVVMSFFYLLERWMVILSVVFSMLSVAKCFLLPFAWILDPEYNNSLRAMFGRSSNTGVTSGHVMVYNNYNPNSVDITYQGGGYAQPIRPNGAGLYQTPDQIQQKSQEIY